MAVHIVEYAHKEMQLNEKFIVYDLSIGIGGLTLAGCQLSTKLLYHSSSEKMGKKYNGKGHAPR